MINIKILHKIRFAILIKILVLENFTKESIKIVLFNHYKLLDIEFYQFY